MTQEEQDVLNLAKGENFLGFDDSGNAIIRNAQGQLSAYGGADWKAVTDALSAQHGKKSYNDYVGNEQLKSLGGEYQGIDEETGAAVFKKDGETFGVEKDNADYKNLFSAAKRTDPSKSWFNPAYEQQFKDVEASGSKFSGFDDKGAALFKNKLGQYETIENKDAGFYKFAKKNMGDQKFAGVQGVSNATAGENISPIGRATQQKTGSDSDRTRRSLADQQGGFSRFNTTNAAPQGQASTNSTVTAPGFNPPSMGKSTAPASQYSATSNAQLNSARIRKKRAAAPQQAPMGIKDIALKMGKEYATNFANDKLAEAKVGAKTAATDYAKEQTQPYFNQAKASTLPYKESALSTLKETTGVDATKSVADQANNAVSNQVGFDAKAAISDPRAYAAQQAGNMASKQVGFDVNAALADPKRFALDQGINAISQYAGDDAGRLGQAANLLRGNVLENTKNLAKEEAKRQALAQVGSFAGVDVNAINGGLNVGKDILKGGVNEDTANMAGQTAARAALATATGGMVSPESLQMSSDLQNKGYNILQDKLGTAGALGGMGLKTGAIGAQVGADALTAGIEAAGATGSNMYNTTKGGLKSLQMIGKGNIGEGVKSAVKTIATSTINNAIKTPVAVAKKVVASVGNAIKSIFCFGEDTLILMEDGSYKKIKDIKLGDRVELGGLVTAIGQSASNDIYYYNSVTVSGGHAVFENGKWTRVCDSKIGKALKGQNALVYPMSTEHHIIVTKGQIWADNLEVDETYDKKDSDILKELNSKNVRNKMLKTYLKVKFGIS